MIFKEVLALGRARLERAGIDEAQVECEQMFMHLLGVSRARLHMQMAQEVLPETEKQFFAWMSEREKRIPLAYLLGDVFFHSLKLKVRSGCLIPRPETELLVDCVASVLSQSFFASEPSAQPEQFVSALSKAQPHELLIADIGCGSGAIGLALLNILKDAQVVLTDISSEAIEIARMNACELKFEKRTEFILSDLFSGFELPSADGQMPRERKFDFIVANPPYITDEDMSDLQPEVAHEPRIALAGGRDGLDFYRKIIPEALFFLKPQSWLGFEIGFGQAQAVCRELEKFGYGSIQVFKDHQDIDRVILARKKG